MSDTKHIDERLREAGAELAAAADRLRAIRVMVAAFDAKCAAAEYTDVGDSWGLLHDVYREAGGDTADLS